MSVGRIFSSTCSGIILIFMLMVRIEAASVFEVRNVAVDVTAKTAAKAREAAMEEGETRAFRQLLERLTLSDDYGKLPKMDTREIAGYVSDFSVSDEKTSAVHFLRFEFTQEMIDSAKSGANWTIQSEHLNYQHSTNPLRAEISQSLLRDFT